jgi:hypothetical protein
MTVTSFHAFSKQVKKCFMRVTKKHDPDLKKQLLFAGVTTMLRNGGLPPWIGTRGYHHVSCSLSLLPIVFITLYFPLPLEIICTEVLPELFFFFRKNMPKYTCGTPTFKTQSSKINTFRARF